MNKGKAVRLVLVPILIGLIATLIVRQLVATPARPAAANPVEMVSVVAIASKDSVPARTQVTAAQLTLKQVPKSILTGNEFKAVADAAGQIALVDLQPGEILLNSRVVPEGQGAMPYRIPEGMRAVTIRTDELNGVAGYPQPGDQVDLVLVLQAKPPERPYASSRLLYEGVRVLAKGLAPAASAAAKPSSTSTSTMGTAGTTTAATPDATKLTSYTLAMKPEEATEVALAEQIGVIKLLLRPALAEPNKGRITDTDNLYK